MSLVLTTGERAVLPAAALVLPQPQGLRGQHPAAAPRPCVCARAALAAGLGVYLYEVTAQAKEQSEQGAQAGGGEGGGSALTQQRVVARTQRGQPWPPRRAPRAAQTRPCKP